VVAEYLRTGNKASLTSTMAICSLFATATLISHPTSKRHAYASLSSSARVRAAAVSSYANEAHRLLGLWVTVVHDNLIIHY